jgi:hypothetical protein
MTINAQEFLEKNEQNLTGKEVKKIALSFLKPSPNNSEEVKLTEDLTIQDYPNLEEISLSNHELTSLTIANCPNLKEINVRNNQLTKIEISGENKVEKIIASKNELTILDLTNSSKITRLIVADNPLLSEIKGLNLNQVKEININNTLVNLNEDYEKLKADKEELLRIALEVKEAGKEGKLMLTEAIESSIQAEEAVQRCLKKIETE